MPAKSSKKKPPYSGPMYQLKISLRGSKPLIWRRLLVPAGCNLEILHAAIQQAMGWTDGHLHAFDIAGETYMGRAPYGDVDADGLDAGEYLLSDVVVSEKSKFRYDYDFGDGWEHTITLEKIIPSRQTAPTAPAQLFTCLKGAGACPMEDCGGIWGYYRLLEILHNPQHEEHEEMKEWAGSVIDPNAFDLDAVNMELSRIRRP